MGPKKTKANNYEITNFYETEEIQPFIIKHLNPNYDPERFDIKHPFPVMIIVGSTGSGKSNVVLNIIQKMDATFNNIFIFTQDANEPLYNYLKSKIPKEFLHIYEGIESFNRLNIEEFFQSTGQTLLIVDDMCNERDQKKFCDMAIKGRKMADNHGVSMIYLSQSYYAIPKTIRVNCKYFVLKKIGSDKDTKAILRDSNVSLEPHELMRMYDYCVNDEITNFLLINKGARKDKMFRKNFDTLINADDFKD